MFLLENGWSKLNGRTQHKISKLLRKFYELQMSKICIPCVLYNEQHFRSERFLPPNGETEYTSFQSFFCRELRNPLNVRQLKKIIPCDGLVCHTCIVDDKAIVNVKGERRHMSVIFGDQFNIRKRSYFTNIYLSASDYHRIHAPVSGRINKVVRIPGVLNILRPNLNIISPSLPAFTNERVNVEIEAVNGDVWFLSIVGGPGVATIKTKINVNDKVVIGEQIAFFKFGSTCCIISPYPSRYCVGEHVEVGMKYEV